MESICRKLERPWICALRKSTWRELLDVSSGKRYLVVKVTAENLFHCRKNVIVENSKNLTYCCDSPCSLTYTTNVIHCSMRAFTNAHVGQILHLRCLSILCVYYSINGAVGRQLRGQISKMYFFVGRRK